ncbi:dTDP-4-dehydrorhamnose reductase family protein [Sporolactobacillus putidus]|uniref:dTDP-4-dehydrorhamnose reductase n=1 Tax=Sporolactobacillus putidus TaxID=492735 RepID=A0A917S1K1_9BACL|nr:SDR family oxidoreductase [Sporolactobacillus putidus]GGL48884.1 NAD(P)-dependent oxidoreductase [Sporolactobacillus putidus]
MKLLIFGGEGITGHILTSYFSEFPNFTVFYTSRDINDDKSIYLNLPDTIKAEEIIEAIRPDVVINCIEMTRNKAEKNPFLAFQINGLFPHQLAKLIERQQGKLIHLSTDCVFSGNKGDYSEKDIADGTSVYAKSKLLGEITDNKHLTIRTSVIGPELNPDSPRLFSRFMKKHTGEIKGYEKLLWNGITTLELAKAIKVLIDNEVTGLYHLGSSYKISEKKLLELMKRIFSKNNVTISPDFGVTLDRSIKNTRTDFEYFIPPYDSMLEELKKWMANHPSIRNNHSTILFLDNNPLEKQEE